MSKKQYRLLLLDNNDSFVYNLYQYLLELYNGEISVIKNDAITLDEVEKYDCIVLSPGPDIPTEAGIMPALIKRYYHSKPILGICLGHQAIFEALGGMLKNLDTVCHGIQSEIHVVDIDESLFNEVNAPILVGRYHSWIADIITLPKDLAITSIDINGDIMSITHKTLPVKGMQFHPESYMTPQGKQMILNFLKLIEQNKEGIDSTISIAYNTSIN